MSKTFGSGQGGGFTYVDDSLSHLNISQWLFCGGTPSMGTIANARGLTYHFVETGVVDNWTVLAFGVTSAPNAILASFVTGTGSIDAAYGVEDSSGTLHTGQYGTDPAGNTVSGGLITTLGTGTAAILGANNTFTGTNNFSANTTTLGTVAGTIVVSSSGTVNMSASGGTLIMPSSTTAHSAFRFPTGGAAPSSPVNGDVWFT
jgi:hypothetical protein